MSKISLYGFNNLTKNLSFSLYKLHYLADDKSVTSYNAYIAQKFSADKLNILLTKICHAIGGNILNIANQDYKPQGASVTLMISEGEQAHPLPNNLIAHLDKSHLCIHTYPDDFFQDSPLGNIAIFRADIELSTCGVISPLKVLNYVIEAFNADVVDIDYRVRGMTRNANGEMLFTDEKIEQVSHFLSKQLLSNFTVIENNLPKQNLFHTRLAKSEIQPNDYVLNSCKSNLNNDEQRKIKAQIEHELQQLLTSV
ncbi:MAG: adenosylmethionine decarboxylase [Colwellia sp.]